MTNEWDILASNQNQVIKSDLCNKEALNYELVHSLNFQAKNEMCNVQSICHNWVLEKFKKFHLRSGFPTSKRDHGGPTNTISQAIFNASFHGTICTVEQPTNIWKVLVASTIFAQLNWGRFYAQGHLKLLCQSSFLTPISYFCTQFWTFNRRCQTKSTDQFFVKL